MGDISKGVTFADGQSVSAADLNNLVDQAVINAGAVTASKLANGAVSANHLAAGFTVSPGQVALGQDLILAGGATNAGVGVSLGTGLAISAGTLTLSGIPGGALANGTIPTGAHALTGAVAGLYGAASRAVRVTANVQGQIAGIDSVPIGGLIRKPPVYPLLLALPAAGSSVTAYHGCLSGNNYEALATATTVSGTVAGITVNSPGLPLWTAPPAISLVGGGGTGATASAMLKVAAVAIQAIGSGYAVNDTLSVAGDSGTQALFTVTSVDSVGAVTGVAIAIPGSFTAVSSAVGRATTTNHAGTGCAITPYYGLDAITVTAGGSGYTSAPTVGIAQVAVVPEACPITLQCTDPGGDLWFSQYDEVPLGHFIGDYIPNNAFVYLPLVVRINNQSVTVQRVGSGDSIQTLNSTGGGQKIDPTKWKVCFRPVNFS